jgi:hypothetical protein
MRNVRETLTPTERHVLHAFFSFMNAAGIASPGHAALVRETGYVKRTIVSAIEGLVRAGLLVVLAESQLLPVKRCAVYKVVVEAIVQSDDMSRDLVAPEHVTGDRGSEIVIDDPVQVILDPCSGDPGAPFEDLEEECKRISEDSTTTRAESPAPTPPTVPPNTARSPSAMPPSQDPLLTSPVTVEAPKRKRATKPKSVPIAVEALTADERAVYDAIVQDVTLVQICSEVPQLARDLVAIATDQSGRIVVNVIAEVRKAAGWNRDNAGTVKAWTTKGGNRGLRSWIERAMARTPIAYPSMRSSPNAAPANGTREPETPMPKVVDLAKNPELMARPMRTARFE